MSVSINGSAGLTFNDGSTQNTSPFAGGFGFRNRIINPDMRIDQRNSGASQAVTTSNAYCVDRWSVRASTGSGHTVQQTTTAPAGFTNSLCFTTGTGASPAAGDVNWLLQPIEGFNAADFAWGTASAVSVTIGFLVRSSLTGTFGGAVQNNANNRSYPFTYTISAANTFEYKTVTIPGDTTGTWLTNNSTGLFLYVSMGMGSNFRGTAGAWAGSDFRGATGETNVVGTSGATFFLTGLQLEKGSTATSFDYRPYGTELALCQRYYSANPQFSFGAYGTTANYPETWVSFKTSMRASPTVSVANAGGNNLSSITVRYATTEGFSVYLAPTANGMVTLGGGGSFSNWNASIEL
jgi:hypothetical protein